MIREKVRDEIKYPLTNPIVFSMVMRDEKLCSELIEKIFPDKKIREIRLSKDAFLETEKNILNGIYNKAVRLDVLFEGIDEWFDIEMQMEDKKDLPKRSRYYHAMIDAHILAKGKFYKELKPCYVIFICAFDPFGLDQAVYTFENIDNNCDLPLKDEAYTIILNTTCPDERIPDSLRTLFNYLNQGLLPDTEDSFIDTAHQEVRRLNQGKELIAVMTLEEEIRYYKEYLREQMEKELREQMEKELREQMEIELQTKLSKAQKTVEETVQETARQTALTMAKAMLADGLSIEQICKYTSLSPDRIKTL